ncbi:hypothetical protein ACWKWF_12330 [Acinetobacter kookii]|nr:hypothetical protein [Acinetobacter kookii]
MAKSGKFKTSAGIVLITVNALTVFIAYSGQTVFQQHNVAIKIEI